MNLIKQHPISIYNSFSRQKEVFKPINDGKIGMYVCGPTVYSDPHLGTARAYVFFDVVFRYFKHLGYQVRYVRNITDVGHLVNDADEGEDKIAKKAKLEQIEPMEVVQTYTVSFHEAMAKLNCLPPSIEPAASGHIIEQIDIIEKSIKAGFAYEVGGSVYFDVQKYSKSNNYGELSGKVLEELLEGTRNTEGGDEKRNNSDFALWKKAKPEHIMRWPSPWSDGFPGWHLECTAMSTKYLGNKFDIHGGGMDLKFPHHEAEIAQNQAAFGCQPVNYWMHNNMLTINGVKMSRSAGNFITITELLTGTHDLLEQAYSPMTVRFAILQAQYRSTIDFSNEGLQAAEKGVKRLLEAHTILQGMEYSGKEQLIELDAEIISQMALCYTEMSNDFNTAKALAILFDLSSKVQSFENNQISINSISSTTLIQLKNHFKLFVEDIFGLTKEESGESSLTGDLVEILIELRKSARENKDFATSDIIRNRLMTLGVQLKDGVDKTSFSIK
jgi:cysteinyl-tRNA synthetase